MTETINRLEELLKLGQASIARQSEEEFAHKPSPEKWSKKEILGHLIDSAVNNLKRFTEIQFETKPYKFAKYNQDALVKANRYQEAKTEEITAMWFALNNRIAAIMRYQTEETLNYQVIITENEFHDLRFLMVDYVEHLEYHLNQLK